VGENATVGCQVNVWIMAEGCREREFIELKIGD